MKRIRVQNFQTIYDIAIQHAGSIDSVVEILSQNGKSSADLLVDEELIIPSIHNQEIVDYFADRAISIATSTEELDPGGFEPPINEDFVTVFVNDVNIGTVPNKSSLLISTNIEPTNVSLNNDELDIELPSDEWKRNPYWFSLDDVQPGDNKFSGLWGVFEDFPASRHFAYQIGGSTTSLVDYGDGNSQVASNLVLYQHEWDYSALAGPVLVHPELGNYKMVVVNIEFGSTTTGVFLDRAGFLGYTQQPTYWLDIALDCPTMSSFNISAQRFSFFLERMRFYDHIINNPNTVFHNLSSLRVLKLDIPLANNFQSVFRDSYTDTRDENNQPLSFTANLATHFNAAFANNNYKKFGVLRGDIATQCNSTFANMRFLETVEEIDMPECNLATSMFSENSALQEVLSLKMPKLVTGNAFHTNNISLKRAVYDLPLLENAANMFLNCHNLEIIDLSNSNNITQIPVLAQNNFRAREIYLGNCSNVSNTTNAFLNCRSLQILRVPNIRISFVISNTAIEAPEMVIVFNDLADLIALSLPTANINISGTPASISLLTSERDIALNKGWTITG